MIRSIAIGATVFVGLLILGTGPALADHGEGHNGETMELSKSDDLVDGEIVTVSLTSFLPGNTVNLVTCYVFPVLGPADCNLANYGQHSSDVATDGTATIDYQVDLIEGSCDQDNPCFIVAADGFGTDANYAAQPITFAAAEASLDDSTGSDADEAAEEFTDDEAAEEAAPAEDDVVDEADVADEAEAVADPADEAQDVADEAAQDVADAVDEASGGGLGWLVLLVIAVLLGALGVFVARRNQNETSSSAS